MKPVSLGYLVQECYKKLLNLIVTFRAFSLNMIFDISFSAIKVSSADFIVT